ncbi:MAG: hypothetical protein H7840_15865 [Alphaproteobacteria bacterium]
MAGKQVSFEIHLFRENRWVMDTVLSDEAKARAFAQSILSDKKIEGVRIIKEWRRLDGTFGEDTIFEKMKSPNKKKDLSISEITAAPKCEAFQDLYGHDGRTTVNRIMRKYLDDVVLTPTELLHSYRDLKRLLDMDITQSAVDKVATLQARQEGGDARRRRDELFGFLEKASQRAKQVVDRDTIPKVKDLGFSAAVSRIDQSAPAEDRDFLAMVAMSRVLVDIRSWLGKMTEVFIQMDKAADAARPILLLDGLVADILGAKDVIPDLLGNQANLGTAIIRLADLVGGRFPLAGRDQGDPIIALNQRLGTNQIGETRATLVDYLVRQIRMTQPLARNEPSVEFEMFKQVLGRLVTTTDIFGGPAVAEAMAQRYLRFLPQGGAPGRGEAVKVSAGFLPTGRQKVRFLTALLDTELGHEQASLIREELDNMVGRAQKVDELVPARAPPKAKMEEVSGMYRILLASSLPTDVSTRLATNLDEILAQFLQANQIIEKLDRPEDSLRLRATRLVQFCASGVLTDGKAFELARKAVLSHLRQPKFEAAFVEGITDPSLQERTIREFHDLLATSNFFRDQQK